MIDHVKARMEDGGGGGGVSSDDLEISGMPSVAC